MKYPRFDAYWLAYLGAHSKPWTRRCHYFGTVLGLLIGVAASLFVTWWAMLVLGPIGYAIALASHPLVQKNRPFAKQPVWGFVCDLRMLGLALTGTLAPHLARAGIATA